MKEPPTPHPDPLHKWSELAAEDVHRRPVPERLGDFRESSENLTEAEAQAQASRCVQCVHPGCVERCPVGSPIEEWVQLVAEGRFREAAGMVRDSTSIPEICARLCPRDHLCERGCVLGGPSNPVSIGAIEQFLQDYALASDFGDGRVAASNGRRVAVVGAGAAGLAAADELSRRGYAVTVLDAGGEPGGGLIRGIAAFRLDPAIVRRRVSILRGRGVEFVLNADLGVGLRLEDLRARFDAVFIGLEARRPRPLLVPGARLSGVLEGPGFLEAATRGQAPDLHGQSVVVVGDDELALDAARTALRCGATTVTVVCASEEAEHGWSRRDYESAQEEGVDFLFERVPVSVCAGAEGTVETVHTVQVRRLAAEDGRGSRLGLVSGTEVVLPARQVIAALGFERHPSPLPGDFETVGSDVDGEVLVDAGQMTCLPGVFAGGDLVRGPCDIVHAIRDARQAVVGIERYLGKHPAAVEVRA